MIRRRTLLRGCVLIGVGPSVTLARADSRADLIDAIKRNAPRDVRSALLRGADPNSSAPGTGPAIATAAAAKAYDALRALLESPETRIDATNARNETALMFAALHGEIDIVRLLLRKGAEVNRPGWTPLHYAASMGRLDVVRLLVDEHAYIDAQSPNQTTPLMMAARHRQFSVIEYLVEQGADPTPVNEAGLSAAEYLARNNELERARWLRQKAADYEAKYGTLSRPKTVEPSR